MLIEIGLSECCLVCHSENTEISLVPKKLNYSLRLQAGSPLQLWAISTPPTDWQGQHNF
jgi:hypothetical protein